MRFAALSALLLAGAAHGDAGPIISFDASAIMITRLNHAGGNGALLRVPGGGPGSFDTVLDRVFDFFDKHSRGEQP